LDFCQTVQGTSLGFFQHRIPAPPRPVLHKPKTPKNKKP
jgi:hypothetical protein